MKSRSKVKKDIKGFIKDDKKYIADLIERTLSNIPDRIFNEAEDNYAISKTILCSIYKEMSRQYAPLNPMNRKQKKDFDIIYSHTR